MSAPDFEIIPTPALLTFVDELLTARRRPNNRDITTIRNRLGACNIAERESQLKAILMRVPEHEESGRWDVLADIVIGLTQDIRLQSRHPHSLTLAKETWRLHGHEAGCAKMVILCLREVQFYWER